MKAQEMAARAAQNPEQAQAAQERLNAILARSATDPAFRQKLLSDPRAAMSEATGRELPASYNVRFVENTADATIVLPDPVDASAELADSELETVAGGITPTVVAAGWVAGGAASGGALYAIGDALF
jgi:hypothetical protein